MLVSYDMAIFKIATGGKAPVKITTIPVTSTKLATTTTKPATTNVKTTPQAQLRQAVLVAQLHIMVNVSRLVGQMEPFALLRMFAWHRMSVSTVRFYTFHRALIDRG